MAQKEYEMQFELNAKLESGYSSAFRAAQQELAQMQNELQALNRLQNDISSHQKQQEALLDTRSKLEMLQQQYDNIQQEINETEGFSATLENRLLSKQQQIEKTTAAIGKQEGALDRLESSLQEAGIDTDSLTSESRRLTEAYDSLKAEQEEIASAFQAGGANAKEFGDTTASALGSVQDVLMSVGIAAVLQKMDQEFQECMAATMEYESAITGVAKTTDLTEEELAEMSSAIQKMATEIPSSTTELAAVAEAAGQLGIQKDAILDFTEVMTMMGTATNMTAEEAATSLARFANISGTSSANYGRLGSVIVDLGNNFATTEREITEMSTRLASAGRLAGLTEAEIMALAASMSSVGIEAEAGGTAMTQTLNQIETAVATGGDSLEEFARIAGMSAEDFSAAWGTDAMQVIQNFVTGLGRLDEQGESAVLVLDELGLSGIRQSNMLKNLALSADSMGDAVSLAAQAWEDNTALQAEAEKRYATLQSQMVMMENSFNNLEVAVGEVFAPSLREAYEIAGSMADEAASFVQDNPEIVKALGITTAGVAGLTAGIGAYTVVTKIATAATTSFNLATNSFNLLVAGATVAISAAVTAAAFLLNETTEDVEELSAVSREQYAELEDLKVQYADVCATYGETSEQAIELKERVDEATAAFEENRQTAQGIEDEYQEVMQAYTDMVAAHKEKLDAVNDEEESATSLISELQRLMSIEEKTAGTKEQILGVVNLLN